MSEKEIISTDEPCLDYVTQTAFDNFGIKYLYPWQRLVVANILEAYDYFKNMAEACPEYSLNHMGWALKGSHVCF